MNHANGCFWGLGQSPVEKRHFRSGENRLPAASQQFIRMREDKTAVADDIPMAQINNIVPVEKSEVVATEYKFPESELLKREMFAKTLKGNLLERTFL